MWMIGPTGAVVVDSPVCIWIMLAETACIHCSALYVFLIHMLLQLIIRVLEINLSLGEHLPTTVGPELVHMIFSVRQTGRMDHISFMQQQ